MKNVLITGATGFVGFHLVGHLQNLGVDVACLVRESSDRSLLAEFNPEFVVGDVLDRRSLESALKRGKYDTVFHLAGLTKSLRTQHLYEVNEQGTRNVVSACAELGQPPAFVLLSSLAARGPDREKEQVVVPDPVSEYGKSKLAGEVAAREFANQLSISIIRAPIVLGEADRDGVTMFRSIANFRLHLVPGVMNKYYSVIDAGDLANACSLVAEHGERIRGRVSHDDETGVYYPADDEIFSYAGLGRAIGDALGKKAFMIRFPVPIVWIVAAGGEVVGQFRRKPSLLNLDKAREATAGSWTCRSDKLRTLTGFAPAKPIRNRLVEIIDWYREQGWMRK